MQILILLIFSFLLAACTQGGTGTAVDSGSLPGGATENQPLDAGFSGPTKDVEGVDYNIPEVQARAQCKEANGDYRVKLSGVVHDDLNQKPVGGYLRISDFTAKKFLVTKAASEGEIGRFHTVVTLRPPFQPFFALLFSEYSPLDTMQAAQSDGLVIVQKADLLSEFSVEGTAEASPCLSLQGGHTYAPVEEDSD